MRKQRIIAPIILFISLFSVVLLQSASSAEAANGLPEGKLESLSCSTDGVVGYAFDEDVNPDSIPVHFYIDNNYAFALNADEARSDVNSKHGISGDHGFVWTIPSEYKDGEKHELTVFAINKGESSGGSPKIGNKSFQCKQPKVTLGGTGSFNEANGTKTLTANLSETYSEDTLVRLAYSGDAIWNIDFSAPNQIVIPAGQLSASITISAKNDALKEPTESLKIDISSVVNGDEKGTQQVIFSIIDDDAAQTNGLDITKAQNNGEVQSLFESTFVGPGVITSNFKQIGSANQFGTFSNGSGTIGASRVPLRDGVVFVTGEVTTASSAAGNTRGGFSSQSDANASDPDLVALSGQNVYDAAGFEFKFQSVTDRIGFVFSFASDEYPEYVATKFNDAFGFFIEGGDEYPTKKNVAIVPGTNDGIAVNTINNGVKGKYAINYPAANVLTNSQFYISNSSDHAVDKSVGPYLEYDGLTTRLVVDAPISRNTEYSIKIAIADAGDAAWDSAVFFETNGFLALTSASDNEYTVSKTSTVAGNFILDDTGDDIDIDPEDGTATLVLTQIDGKNINNGPVILPSGATLYIGADGAFTYDPSTSTAFSDLSSGQSATDTFTYTIVDDIGITDTATITMTVLGKSSAKITCDSTGFLFNTGFNPATGGRLSVGQLDPNWEVGVGSAAGPNTASQWHPAWVTGQRYGWATSPFGNADWISFNSDGNHSGKGDYFYRYRFDLDSEVNTNNFALNFDFFADDSITEIYINGQPQSAFISGIPQGSNGYEHNGYSTGNGASTSLDRYWKVGSNEIIIHTQSRGGGEGLLAQVTAEAVCPPTVTLTGGGEMLEIGGTGKATLTLDKAVDYPVTVKLGYSGEAAYKVDFDGPSEVVIPAGQTSLDIDLTAIEDFLVEGDESFTLEIVDLVNGVKEGIQSADFTIIDVPPVEVAVEGPAVLYCGSRAPVRFLTDATSVLTGVDARITFPSEFEVNETTESMQVRARKLYGNQADALLNGNVITLQNLTIPEGEVFLTLLVKPRDLTLSGEFSFTTELFLDNNPEPIKATLPMSIATSADTDNDGIPDCRDDDDDNDGLTDIIECGITPALSLVNGGFEEPDITSNYMIARSRWGSLPTMAVTFNHNDVKGWNTTAALSYIEVWQSGHGGVASFNGRQHAEINAYQFATLYQDVATIPNSAMDWKFAHRGRAGYDTIRLEFGPPEGPFEVIGEFVTGKEWAEYSGEYRVPAGQTTTRFRYVAVETAASNISVGNLIDGVEFYTCSLDSDQDGVLDKYDLDSDNDGITDLRESGQDADEIDQNEDGRRDDMATEEARAQNDKDNDGLSDAIDEDSDEGPRDTDKDGLYDYVDIDADGDGIPDHVEAQPTLGYISPTASVDQNGIPVNLNGAGIVPANSDGDEIDDYIDTDSDNDGLLDIEENGMADAPVGRDTDKDGLDDAFEGLVNNDPLDVNDEIDRPAIDLPDNDNDVNSGGNVDYRDNTLTFTGLVWKDVNLDGIRELTEPTFPNAVVELHDSDGEILNTAFTNSAGEYLINGSVADLQAGYYVKFIRPPDFLFTLKDIGLDTFDSDPDPFTGHTDLLYYPEYGSLDAGLFDEELDHGDAPSSYGDSYTIAGTPYDTLWMGGRFDVPDTEDIVGSVIPPFVGDDDDDDEDDDDDDSSSSKSNAPLFGSATNLGSNVMADNSFTSSSSTDAPANRADGDDTSGSADDEEGVQFIDSESPDATVYYLVKQINKEDSEQYKIEVEVYNPTFDEAYLEGWIDFNGNGTFEDSDIIVSRSVTKSPTPYTVDVFADVPLNAACGHTYARFRVSDRQLTDPYGYGGFGETEDHLVLIDCRTDLEIKAQITPTPTVQLSDFVDFTVSVKNHGPNPARTMTVNFSYPEELVDLVYVPLNGWTCTFGEDSAVCTKVGLDIDAEEEVFTFSGRVSGTYDPDFVAGELTVSNEIEDLDDTNNTLLYSVEVDKEWRTIAGAQYIEQLFLHTRFSAALGASADRSTDFGPNELVANPINVPIDIAPGISMSSYPTLTTEYCTSPSHQHENGCKTSTDIISGTIMAKSYEFITMTAQTLAGSSYVPTVGEGNMISSSAVILFAPDNNGRYADPDPDRCQDFVGDLGGHCNAEYSVWGAWGSYGSGGLADLYAYSDSEFSQILFQTTGGRDVNCGPGAGQCLRFQNAKPGVYYIEGEIEYEFVFHDPDHVRLGTPTRRITQQVPYGFYLQILAPFVIQD